MTEPSQDTVSVEVEITWDDVRELHRLRAEPWTGPAGRFWRWLGPDAWSWRADLVVLGMFLVGMTYLLILYPTTKALVAGTVTVGPLCVLGALVFHTPWVKRIVEARADVSRVPQLHGYVGPMLVTIDANGVWQTDNDRRRFWHWSAIEPEVTDDMIYLHFDRHRAVLVPRRSFSSPSRCEAFIKQVESLRAEVGEARVPGIPTGLTSSPPYNLEGDDLAKAYLAGAPSLIPSSGAVTYTVLTALPVWGMCPIWNPAWQSWVAFPVGFGFQLHMLFGAKLWKRRRRRQAGYEALRTTANPGSFQDVKIGFDSLGITELTANTRTQVRWSAVRQYEISTDVAVFHDGTGISVLPRHAFQSDDEYFDFIEQALEFRRNALAA